VRDADDAGERVRLEFPFGGPAAEVAGGRRDGGVLATIRTTGEYEPHLMVLFAAVLKSDGVCLDVGANIGAHTIAMSRLVPDGVVIAVEPEPSTAAFLAENVARNCRGEQAGEVRVRRVGLHSKAGTLTLHTSAAHPGGAFTATTESADVASVEIPVVTLDQLVDEENLPRVDLIKIDVEGGEVGVLAGAATTLTGDRPVVVAECNPVPLWRFQRLRPGELLARLSERCGPVGRVTADGTVRPIHNAVHLGAVLGQSGLVDLVAGSPMEIDRRERLRWQLFGSLPRVVRTGLRRLRHRLDGSRRASPEPRYVIDPAGSVEVSADGLRLEPGEQRRVDVEITNRSNTWWSSDFPIAPIHVGSRTREAGTPTYLEGPRGRLRSPIGPGRHGRASVEIVAPIEPGRQVVEVSLVQEGYCWFADMDPDFAATVVVTVVDR
jgi:FkbM family methyltransferase